MTPNTSQEGAQPNPAPRLNPVLTPEQAQAERDLLYHRFGPKAVFILIDYGKKTPVTEFKRLTWKQTQSPKYQKALVECIRVGGNIGLILGDNIRAIDLDRPALLERFLIVNPLFAPTVQSRGAHGGQIFFRMDEGAGFPNSQAYYHFYLEGKTEPIGEWRCGPNVYSVVYGWLNPEKSGAPEGVRYKLFGEELVKVERWDQIHWPYDFLLPWNSSGEAGAPPTGQPTPAPPESPEDPDDRVDPDDQGDQKATGGTAAAAAAAATLDEHLEKRIRAYLDACDPAISGSGGHNTTFRVACALRQGFMLGKDDCLRLLEYYNQKCQPPWSSEELEHKVADAFGAPHKKPPGYLLDGAEIPPNSTASPPQSERTDVNANGFVDLVTLADEPDQPELDLLGNGFLRRGGGMFIIGPTDCGKSTLSVQGAVEWSCGLEGGIIKPSGPLRVIVIQAEDDRQDSREMARVYKRLGLSEEQIGLVRRNTRFIEWCPKGYQLVTGENGGIEAKKIESGRELTEFLEAEIQADGPVDLVIVNPLSAYMDEGVMSQSANRAFFYGWITPFLKRQACGIIFVHHTPKFRDDMREMMRHAQLYAGAGDATITNWPRASLFIWPTRGAGLFRFVAGKHGGRIGWEGTERFFKWSQEGFILWQEAAKPEVEEFKSAKRTTGKEQSISAQNLYKVLKTFREEGVLRGDLVRALIEAGYTEAAARRTIDPVDGYQRENLAYEGRGKKMRIKWKGFEFDPI